MIELVEQVKEEELKSARRSATIISTPSFDGKVIGCGLTPDRCGVWLSDGGNGSELGPFCNLMPERRRSAGPLCGFNVRR